MNGSSGASRIRYVGIEEAAGKISAADRLMVIGCSGGGKSTLSQKIAGRFGLEYVSIDRDILWLPGWVQRPKPDQHDLIREFIAHDRWIMDGNNTSTFDIRVPRSDLVIWVHMPRWLCVWGIFSRWAKYRGQIRPDMAPGCPEQVTWEFFRFVWTWEKIFAPRVTAALEAHAGKTPVLMLKSRADMRRLVELLGA